MIGGGTAFRRLPTLLLAGLFLLTAPACTLAEFLRIVSWNTRNAFEPYLAPPAAATILQGLGQERWNTIQRPADVLLLQEQNNTTSSTTQSYLDLMNGLYGAGTYAKGTLVAGATVSPNTDSGAIIYNTRTVQLIAEKLVGNPSTSGQPRQQIRYRLRPVGYTASDDFYAYNGHYKAFSGSTNEQRRLVEATAVRADADALGQGARIIYAGDFNLTGGSAEPAYQKLLSAGPGQAFDPIRRPGMWTNNAAFLGVHTASSTSLDARFDFQLVSEELLSGPGLRYVDGSYRVFGNNGSVPIDGSVNSPSNTALQGLPNRAAVLAALASVSDHLPVVADFRLPYRPDGPWFTPTPIYGPPGAPVFMPIPEPGTCWVLTLLWLVPRRRQAA
jgi:endonuclease/exonuclease/phosphatase family metal-dependent hydrolase